MWCSAIGCIVTLILSLLAAPLATEAQPVGKIPRLGVLALGLPDRGLDPFRQGLQDLGYVEGKTIAIAYRFAEGKAEIGSRSLRPSWCASRSILLWHTPFSLRVLPSRRRRRSPS